MAISIPGTLFLIFFIILVFGTIVKKWKEGNKVLAFQDLIILIINNAIFLYGNFPLAVVYYGSVLGYGSWHMTDEQWSGIPVDQRIAAFGIVLVTFLSVFGFFQWIR